MSARDGGPAFPVGDHEALHAIGMDAVMHLPAGERDAPYIAAKATAARGMSLRDYFAGVALHIAARQHEAANASLGSTRAFDEESVARRSYRVADAMLAERAKGGAR